MSVSIILKLTYAQHISFVEDVLHLLYSGQFFCLQPKKGSENAKKTRIFSKEEIKQQLIDSIVSNDIIKTEELNEEADQAEKPEDAAAIIKQYEDIFRGKKKNMISIAYHQGKVF